MDKKNLVSLKICSIMIFVIGVMLIVAGIHLFSKMSLLIYKDRGVFTSYFYLITGLLLLVSSIGLILLKAWARLLTIICSAAIILFTLERSWFFHHLISAHSQNYQAHSSKANIYYYTSLCVVALFSLLVYFLLRPKIKEQFK